MHSGLLDDKLRSLYRIAIDKEKVPSKSPVSTALPSTISSVWWLNRFMYVDIPLLQPTRNAAAELLEQDSRRLLPECWLAAVEKSKMLVNSESNYEIWAY